MGKLPRVWFYRPSWFWFGWRTLLPAYRGHDEFARWTLMLGWTITGRMVIALKHCGNVECEAEAMENAPSWASLLRVSH